MDSAPIQVHFVYLDMLMYIMCCPEPPGVMGRHSRAVAEERTIRGVLNSTVHLEFKLGRGSQVVALISRWIVVRKDRSSSQCVGERLLIEVSLSACGEGPARSRYTLEHLLVCGASTALVRCLVFSVNVVWNDI